MAVVEGHSAVGRNIEISVLVKTPQSHKMGSLTLEVGHLTARDAGCDGVQRTPRAAERQVQLVPDIVILTISERPPRERAQEGEISKPVVIEIGRLQARRTALNIHGARGA